MWILVTESMEGFQLGSQILREIGIEDLKDQLLLNSFYTQPYILLYRKENIFFYLWFSLPLLCLDQLFTVSFLFNDSINNFCPWIPLVEGYCCGPQCQSIHLSSTILRQHYYCTADDI